jgi:chorismate mutase-like protein
MTAWLSDIRAKIDKVDLQIITLIAKRFAYVAQVGKYKKEKQIPMMQQKRVDEIIGLMKQRAEALNLSPIFLENLYTLIIQEACRMEDIIIGSSLA